MDLKIAARMTAVIAIVAGLTATLMAIREPQRAEETPVLPSLDPGGEPETGTERVELHRCRDLGAEALKDKACRKAGWKAADAFSSPRTPASQQPQTLASIRR